jgi:PTS system nitrogen regulatory IIA component
VIVMELAGAPSLLDLACIRLDAPVLDVRAALEESAELLRRRHGLRASMAMRRLWARERRRSTALGWGVAIPHADVGGLQRPHAAFLRAAEPVDFHAPDGRPVDSIFVLVVPRPALASHHQLLSHYQRLLVQPGFRKQLDDCREPGDVWRLFDHHAWHARLLAAA